MHFSTPKPKSRVQKTDDPDSFDLSSAEHYALVKRIYQGRFSARIQAAGLDQDDTFQTLLEGLLRKSQSERSRWDPTRGSVSTWIYVALSGLVINLVQASERRRAMTGDQQDVASWPLGAPNDDVEIIGFVREARHREPLETDGWPVRPVARFRDPSRQEVVRVDAGHVRARARPDPVPYTPPAEYPPVERFRNRSRAHAIPTVQLMLFDRR